MYSPDYMMWSGSPPWTSAGASTMSDSRKETNGRWLSFSMNQGLFEPLIMFFRLCNSPTTFQTMMNNILHPFIDHNEAVCYMDDILIYSASLSDHWRIT